LAVTLAGTAKKVVGWIKYKLFIFFFFFLRLVLPLPCDPLILFYFWDRFFLNSEHWTAQSMTRTLGAIVHAVLHQLLHMCSLQMPSKWCLLLFVFPTEFTDHLQIPQKEIQILNTNQKVRASFKIWFSIFIK